MTWPLVRAFRVDVRVSWTVVLWPVFFGVSFAKWLPWGEALAWGAAWTFMLYLTTWTHEMGHIVAGRRLGIETETMTLRALGGLAHMGAPAQTPREEILIAVAGPLTHIAWLVVAAPAAWLLEPSYGGEMWFAMLSAFTRLQVSMMVFNLLPIYPLDGGRVLRGFLSTKIHPNVATLHTSTAGFVGNGALMLLGLVAWAGVYDPLGYGRFGFLLAWIGFEGIQACRALRMEARYSEVYAAPDSFQRALLASQAAMRGYDEEERRERDERRAAREDRERHQATVDRLLDRINEVGGIEKLSSKERRELETASRKLKET